MQSRSEAWRASGAGEGAIEKLQAVRYYEIEGTIYYRMRDICDALDIPACKHIRDNISSWILPEHKRYKWEIKRTQGGKLYSDRRFCYIDRTGVERIVLRYGGKTPRAALLRALPVGAE